MTNQILLNQLEYSIPTSAIALNGVKENHFVAEHLPLMSVRIDFANGSLKLDGDWQYMISTNEHNDQCWLSFHRERIYVEMDIYPAGSIDLLILETDGLVFPLEGNIKDDDSIGSCSGILVVENKRGNNGLIGTQWTVGLYIYDLYLDKCEIKFKLPVYLNKDKVGYN